MRHVACYVVVTVLAVALFTIAADVDLAASRLFYDAEEGFVLANWPPAVALFRAVPWITWGILVLIGAAAAWLFLMGQPLWRLDRKALVFVTASIILAPGLLANALLKDHWGRARPVQIETFGGPHHFTPALLPVAECERNCAFVSGHAALGFSLLALAFLFPPGRVRGYGIAAAICFGALVGLGRIAQGAHFLSDVVFAGLVVYGVTALLYWWIVQRDGLAAPLPVQLGQSVLRNSQIIWAAGRYACASPVARAALATAAAAILVLMSIGFVDQPVAASLHTRDSDLRSLFDIIGRLGLTYGYLIAFGVAFGVLHWGGGFPRLRSFAGPMRALSAVPAFVFISVAASGIIVDGLKIIFGRPRPKLFFQSDIYAFSWLSWRPDHWSFPSGHAATIAALMTALWYLWPQHLLFYILAGAIVAASRVVVGAHYLSDVLAGALVAVVTTRCVAGLLAKGGIDLAASRLGLSASRAELPWPCRQFIRSSAGRKRIGSG